MVPGATYSIHKDSMWRTRQEIRDESGNVLGSYEMANWSYTKGTADVRGKQYTFGHNGWDSRYSYMEASGAKIATIEPVGWWGTQYKLTHKGHDYEFKLNGWRTTFSILENDMAIVRVRPGGYFRPGTVSIERSHEDIVPLILFGLYYMSLLGAQMAASGSVATYT